MEHQKFTLGKLVATKGAIEALTAEQIAEAISRHARGDWGDLCEEDAAENELALDMDYLRIFSRYNFNPPVYVITEADRSVTTVLLVSEY